MAADATTQEMTGQKVTEGEKTEQRDAYLSLVRELPCLRNKWVTDRVLRELEWVHTNWDFLDAMSKIEPTISRVRWVLVGAQILDHSRDVFSPLELRSPNSTRPVSVLDRLMAQQTSQNHALAVSFINRVLQALWQKTAEVQKWASRVSEGVYHGDYDFSNLSYALQSATADVTDVSRALWNGVQFEHRAKWYELMKLCLEHKPGDIIPQDVVIERLYPDEEWDKEAIITRLNATLNNVLSRFRDQERPKPFIRLRKNGNIQVLGDQVALPAPVLDKDVSLNEEFLDAPISLAWTSIPDSPLSHKKTPTVADFQSLALSDDALLIATYLLENADLDNILVSQLLSAIGRAPSFALEIPKCIEEINKIFEKSGFSGRFEKEGSKISFKK